VDLRRGWTGSRGRISIALRVALGFVIAIVGLVVGLTRNPLGYTLLIVGVFMIILFLRVGASAEREDR
jgi:4-hydroxybenzoate polyprenyltransferase